MPLFFKLLGALGMVLITTGIIKKSALARNYLFAVGGILLFAYSCFLRDPIFIPLQAIFTLASLYKIYKIKK